MYSSSFCNSTSVVSYMAIERRRKYEYDLLQRSIATTRVLHMHTYMLKGKN